MLKQWLRSKKGQTTTEYVLAVLLCLIISIILKDEFFTKKGQGKLNATEQLFYNVEYTVTKPYP